MTDAEKAAKYDEITRRREGTLWAIHQVRTAFPGSDSVVALVLSPQAFSETLMALGRWDICVTHFVGGVPTGIMVDNAFEIRCESR